MKFNFFGLSDTKTSKPAKETFTGRQKPKHTSTSSSRPKTTPAEPKLPECPTKRYIPYHRNLGVKPGASPDEVKAAWRRTGLRLHPDKIRDPAQREVAAAAMILVNEAYEKLYKGYWWGWLNDNEIDSAEALRRAEEKSEDHDCSDIVRRKPWFWAYKETLQCERDNNFFCGEFWATITHNVVDIVLPFRLSDRVWDSIDRDWSYGTSALSDFEKLTFYGACYQVYTVKLPALRSAQLPPRWSSFRDTKCDTTLNLQSLDGLALLFLISMALIFSRKILFRILAYCVATAKLCLRVTLWFVVKVLWLCTWPVRKMFQEISFVCSFIPRTLFEVAHYMSGSIPEIFVYVLALARAFTVARQIRNAYRQAVQ